MQAGTLKAAYADWLREAARSEIRDGCAEIGSILDDFPLYFVEVTEQWSPEEKLALMSARIKQRTWMPDERQALRLLRNRRDVMPETVTAEMVRSARRNLTEEEEQVDSRFRWPPEDMKSSVLATIGTERLRGGFKIDSRSLRRSIKKQFDLAMGKPLPVPTEPAWLQYVIPSGGVHVHTYVHFGGKGLRQFGYFQELRVGRVDPSAIPEHGEALSHVSKLNILGSATNWSCMREPDVEASATLAVKFCTDFVRAVPSFAASH